MCCARSCLFVPRLKTTTIISKRFIILTTDTVATNLTNAVLSPVQAYPVSMVMGENAEFSAEQNNVMDEVMLEH